MAGNQTWDGDGYWWKCWICSLQRISYQHPWWAQHETNPLPCSRSFTVFVLFLQGGLAGSILNWMICFHPLSVFNYALQTIQHCFCQPLGTEHVWSGSFAHQVFCHSIVTCWSLFLLRCWLQWFSTWNPECKYFLNFLNAMVQVQSPDLSQGNLEKCLQGYERYELLPGRRWVCQSMLRFGSVATLQSKGTCWTKKNCPQSRLPMDTVSVC